MKDIHFFHFPSFLGVPRINLEVFFSFFLEEKAWPSMIQFLYFSIPLLNNKWDFCRRVV